MPLFLITLGLSCSDTETYEGYFVSEEINHGNLFMYPSLILKFNLNLNYLVKFCSNLQYQSIYIKGNPSAKIKDTTMISLRILLKVFRNNNLRII